jgi:hypothetical protein
VASKASEAEMREFTPALVLLGLVIALLAGAYGILLGLVSGLVLWRLTGLGPGM